jgi:hypothetical protein
MNKVYNFLIPIGNVNEVYDTTWIISVQTSWAPLRCNDIDIVVLVDAICHLDKRTFLIVKQPENKIIDGGRIQ